MYLADTNILLRFLLKSDAAYPDIRAAVRILKRGGSRSSRHLRILQNFGMSVAGLLLRVVD